MNLKNENKQDEKITDVLRLFNLCRVQVLNPTKNENKSENCENQIKIYMYIYV